MHKYGWAARSPSLLLVRSCWVAVSPLDPVVCLVACGWEMKLAVLLVPGVLSLSSVCLGAPGCAGAALCPLRAAGYMSGKRIAFPGVRMRAVRHGCGERAAAGSSIAGLRELCWTFRQEHVCSGPRVCSADSP